MKVGQFFTTLRPPSIGTLGACNIRRLSCRDTSSTKVSRRFIDARMHLRLIKRGKPHSARSLDRIVARASSSTINVAHLYVGPRVLRAAAAV